MVKRERRKERRREEGDSGLFRTSGDALIIVASFTVEGRKSLAVTGLQRENATRCADAGEEARLPLCCLSAERETTPL